MLKRSIIILAAIVGLLVLALALVYLVSSRALARRWVVEPAPVAIPTDAAAREEGLRLYFSRGCADCHDADFGGKTVIEDPMMGLIAGPNLTAGAGGIGGRSDLDLVRAIRHGLAPDGRGLVFMPSHEFNPLADAEVGAIIAAIRAAAPIDRPQPAPAPGPLLRALFVFGQVPMLLSADLIDHEAPRPPAPEVAPTAAYGAYLAILCTGCHGPGLSGGPIPGAPPDWPPSTNITPDPTTGLGAWTEEDFVRAMRSGIRRDGSAIHPVMPWRNFARMTDVEISALWAHLSSLPPRTAGTR